MSWELVVLAGLTAGVIFAPGLWRRWRERYRARLRRQPFSSAWRTLLERHLDLYRRLPADLRERLHADMQVFLAEKRFIGADGLEVDDTMRLVVAAQACLLTLNQATRYYPDFTSIILYPDSFVAVETVHDGVLESTTHHVRAGESWYRGPLVLSWADVAADLAHPGHGHNVVLHEFAHKLDEQDGLVDGAPELDAGQRHSWPRVFGQEFERLRHALDRGEHTFIDPYAATAPAEFFAVAVEAFFDASRPFAHHHPELHGELCRLFGFDPVHWHARAVPA
ncbi:MAG: zinc-dependent peptidase [Gammaproteobacteria bacterium]